MGRRPDPLPTTLPVPASSRSAQRLLPHLPAQKLPAGRRRPWACVTASLGLGLGLGFSLGLAPARALAQAAEGLLTLQPSPRLAPLPDAAQQRGRPVILQADRIQARPDADAVAEGAVEFRRAGTVIRADRLSYDSRRDVATAKGQVLIQRADAQYRGTELQLQLERFEGFFLQPEFAFPGLGSGGRAERVDFIDSQRSRAQRAVYTSCPRDGGGEPDWLLRTERIRIDLAANEGIAEGAVLQFLGVPILGLPVLSFPLTDDRKSGWLPPTILPVDSRNGFTVGVPYYWNIAPNRDATITPTVYTRRGLAVEGEFRYLEPRHAGTLRLQGLPNDRALGRSRHAWQLDQEGQVGGALPAAGPASVEAGTPGSGLRYSVLAQGVSDDAYWKDFPQLVPATSPRLLSQQVQLERSRTAAWGTLSAYARVQHWQVLQTGVDSEAIVAPYQRSPQLGLRLEPLLPAGLRGSLETEVNHFTRPDGSASAERYTGWRWHAQGSVSRTWGTPGLWLRPQLSLNAAAYTVDQRDAAVQRGSRLLPTASVDAGLVLERDSTWLGRAQRQTLEPRLLYVNTPYKDQSRLPNFDAAERDFNTVSIYSGNAFSGIDRVSDAHQATAGVTMRLVDAETGAETLRLGLAQRVRFRAQRTVLEGEPLSQRFSNVLVDGSTSVFRPWQFDAALQYDPDSQRVVRSIIGARFAPGPFRTVSVGYRLARGLSEQVELGWQWPVYRGTATPVGASAGCGGTVYAVGRINYSLKDGRTTDSILGLEYDSGCWIARVLAERLSTGRAEATTKVLLQLELVGLSRLGANPLQVLKDNIPGYRLLREPRRTGPFAEP